MSLIVGSSHVSQEFGGQRDLAERLRKMREVTEEFRLGMKNGNDRTEITFGRIVKLVDFMPDPYSMTHQSSAGDGWPRNAGDCNLTFLERLLADKVGYLSSSHANQNHFQGRAMFAFWFWHREAIREARDGNLFGGLLLEAYANHFLEDLFAPGHILAPRDENAHDVYTLTLHDYYNSRGLTYVVGEPAQLRPMIKQMEALVRTTTLTMPPDAKPGDTKRLDLDMEKVQSFARSLQGGTLEVECHGDGGLRQNPMQLPLIVGYCARAVSDVLESWLRATEVNSFQHYHWHAKVFPMQTGKADVEAIDMRIAFGALSCVDNPRTIEQEGRRPWAPLADRKDQARDTFPVTESIHIDAYHNPVVGLNFGIQTVSLGSEMRVRGMFDAEVMVMGKRFDFQRQDWQVPEWLPGQVAVTLGYSGVAGSDEIGNGPYGRIIVPFPRINMDLSLMAGARYYSDGSVNEWGDFEKVRAEWGLHMVSIFMGVGHERAISGSKLSDGVGFEMGVTLGGPVTSFHRLIPSTR